MNREVAVFQTQCSGLCKPRTAETRPYVPEPQTQGHSAEGRMKALEWNWMWQAAKQGKAGWDKGRIRVQKENRSRTADRGFVPMLGTWEDLTGWKKRSHRTWEDRQAGQSAAPVQKPEWAPFYRLLGEAFIFISSPLGFLLHIYFPRWAPTGQMLMLHTHCAGALHAGAQSILPTPLVGGCYSSHLIAKETGLEQMTSPQFYEQALEEPGFESRLSGRKCMLSTPLLSALISKWKRGVTDILYQVSHLVLTAPPWGRSAYYPTWWKKKLAAKRALSRAPLPGPGGTKVWTQETNLEFRPPATSFLERRA